MGINEKMMQFILEKKFFDEFNLRTICGKKITIKFLGILNSNQGPDFLHSRILIDNTEWAGSIELHVNTSDWVLHRHHLDKNYINVVLHIVWKHDTKKFIQSHVLELSDYVDIEWREAYLNNFVQDGIQPCSIPLKTPLSSNTIDWVKQLGHKRLLKKTDWILTILKSVNGDWDEVAWRVITSNFGYKVNSAVFFQIACSIPYKLISRLGNDSFLIESLLMGQAGLLDQEFTDDYPKQLKSAYLRLKSIYLLKDNEHPLYFLRMRPQNFPTIRLSQLAIFFSKVKSVFDFIENVEDIKEFSSQNRFAASAYWDCHYVFDRLSKKRTKHIGKDFSNNIILNSMIPLFISYGISIGDPLYFAKGRQWLDSMPFETNKNTGFFKHVIIPKNAFESQSLLELFNDFCKNNRCEECFIAREIRHVDSC